MSLTRSAPLPEEVELQKKLRIAERLKDRLADSEESLATFRAELDQFEARYKMEVGRLYADLDEIEALHVVNALAIAFVANMLVQRSRRFLASRMAT